MDINAEWENFISSGYNDDISCEDEDAYENIEENNEEFISANISMDLTSEAPKATSIYISTKTKIAYLNTQIDLSSMEAFLPMLNFFFHYLYVPTNLFSKLVLNYLPKTVDMARKLEPFDIILNSMLIFLVMVFIISSIVCNNSATIKNTLFTYVSGSTNAALTNMLYPVILFSMLLSIFPSSVLGTLSSTFNLVTAPVSTLFGGLFKLIFTLINVGISGIFFILFIFIHSFFSISIYSNTSIKTTLNNINEFLYESINNIGKYDCPPDTLSWWLKYLKIFLEIIHVCLYEFIFVLFFLMGLIIYLLFINSAINKVFFALINLMIIVGISIYSYFTKIKDLLEELDSPVL
jgi:hypothetical protein